MRRWLRGLVVIAAAVLLGPLGTAAAPKGRADVSAYNTDAGLRLVYELDRPTRQLRLALDESAVRDDTWSVVTPGLTLKDDVVSGEAPFRRVELLVRPMKGERDAVYPAMFRVGRGLVLYARYLHADPALYDTRVRFRPAAAETVVPREPARREGFVFIGPADALRRQGAFDVVLGPGVPPWLLDEITDGLRDSSGVFEKALRVKPRRAGLVMVTYGDEGRGDVVADVTTGGIIAFRFHGKQWAERSPIGEARVRRLVPHEAFHLWNGELAHNAEGTPSWLHEGGAEYASLEAQLAAGHVSEAAAAERLTDDLGRCQRALGADSLTSTKRTDMGFRYPCGMVVQWLADLHARRASAGTRTVLTAWGDTVRLAQGNGGAYTLDQYWVATGMADPPSRPEALRLLLDATGADRWRQMAPALRALGVEAAWGPRPDDYRATAMWHVLRLACPQKKGVGWWDEAEGLRLDTDEGCGALSGQPRVTLLEGHDIVAAPQAMFAAVQAKCAAGQPVAFTTVDTKTLEAPCTKPLAAAPEAITVLRRLPLPRVLASPA